MSRLWSHRWFVFRPRPDICSHYNVKFGSIVAPATRFFGVICPACKSAWQSQSVDLQKFAEVEISSKHHRGTEAMKIIVALLLLLPALALADAEDDAAMLRGTLELQRMQANDRAEEAEDLERSRQHLQVLELQRLDTIHHDLQNLDEDEHEDDE